MCSVDRWRIVSLLYDVYAAKTRRQNKTCFSFPYSALYSTEYCTIHIISYSSMQYSTVQYSAIILSAWQHQELLDFILKLKFNRQVDVWLGWNNRINWNEGNWGFFYCTVQYCIRHLNKFCCMMCMMTVLQNDDLGPISSYCTVHNLISTYVWISGNVRNVQLFEYTLPLYCIIFMCTVLYCMDT